MYHTFFKNFLDVLVALTVLLVCFPLLLLIALIVYLDIKEHPLFIQDRPGKNGVIFKVLKFKTMNSKTDENGNLFPDKDRLTSIGVFLRKYSLDEIPQLINILKGDMSIVGPRPLLPEYLELYNERQYKRHNVKPGITGWAQVNGRNAISWEQKFELDLWYINNLSLYTDIKILCLTIAKVFKAENINTAGQATTKKFKGSS